MTKKIVDGSLVCTLAPEKVTDNIIIDVKTRTEAFMVSDMAGMSRARLRYGNKFRRGIEMAEERKSRRNAK